MRRYDELAAALIQYGTEPQHVRYAMLSLTTITLPCSQDAASADEGSLSVLLPQQAKRKRRGVEGKMHVD